MSLFYSLFQRLIPLYLIVGAGFIAGRYLRVDRDSVAKIAIYLIAPVVVFTNVSQIELKPEYLAVPFLFLGLCSLIALLFLKQGNLLAFAAGNANTGYFGLPVALMLFGPEVLGVYLLFGLGFLLYENSVGFYILARGHATPAQALRRLTKLPTLYAFGAALLANHYGLKITGVYADFSGFFRGTYSVLGMMLVGLGVAELRTWRFDWRFVSVAFAAKFLVWPILTGALVLADQHYFHRYDPLAHRMMELIACTPLAANTVAFATLLKSDPEKAGVAVLLSTAFALFYIPLVAIWLFPV